MQIIDILKNYFGYDSFRSNQEAIIREIMQGKDCLVLMPTGGGKSLCYQIPALALPGTAVVISPLISLMHDQVEALKANGIPAEALNSSTDTIEETIIRRRCEAGDLKIIYVSPEKLLSEILQGVPVMALTATADKITREDIVKQLHLNGKTFVSSFDRPNLSLAVRREGTKAEKIKFILRHIGSHPGDAGIIYCLSRKNTEVVAEELKKKGINAAAYHAGLPTEERASIQERFKMDQIQVVCATIAFGMGIDKGNVRWVIHYNLPQSIESFYQEIGRAGRDGAPADTILFYSLADVIQRKSFAEASGQKAINAEKLQRMQEYAEARVCRRRILLNYFGETSAEDCGHCDVCAHPPRTFDGTIVTQKALSAIVRTNEKIHIGQCIEVLRGIKSSTVVRNHYNELKTFGVGSDVSVKDWQNYMLQMMQMGFFEIAYNEHNVMKVTSLGWQVLKGEHPVQLAVIQQSNKGKTPVVHPRLVRVSHTRTENQDLFERLRKLRLKLATEQGYPPYIILSDQSLHELAAMKPRTIEQFGLVHGIGEFKKKKYGEIFLKEINKEPRMFE